MIKMLTSLGAWLVQDINTGGGIIEKIILCRII